MIYNPTTLMALKSQAVVLICIFHHGYCSGRGQHCFQSPRKGNKNSEMGLLQFFFCITIENHAAHRRTNSDATRSSKLFVSHLMKQPISYNPKKLLKARYCVYRDVPILLTLSWPKPIQDSIYVNRGLILSSPALAVSPSHPHKCSKRVIRPVHACPWCQDDLMPCCPVLAPPAVCSFGAWGRSRGGQYRLGREHRQRWDWQQPLLLHPHLHIGLHA